MNSKIRIDSIKAFLSKHYKIVGFLAGVVLLLLDFLINNLTAYCYDSNGYNIMSDVFLDKGLFNFSFGFEDVDARELFTLRGYAWPFIISICKTLGLKTQIGYWFWISVFYSVGLSYALSEMFEILFEKKIEWYMRVIPVLLTILFWNGLVIYPLSDIPAVVSVSIGLCALCKISEEKNLIMNCVLALAGGMAFGVSYYIRSGCKPIIILAVIILLFLKMKKQYIKKIVVVCVMCLGCISATVPQVLINTSCINISSYEVPIFLTMNVVQGSYYGSFYTFRYETSISPNYPEIVMLSNDNMIDNIIKNEDVGSGDMELKTVLLLMAKYPLEFLGMFAAKFGDYLDPRWGNEIYVSNLNPRQYVIMFTNYILWFLAFWGLGIELTKGIDEGESTQFGNILFFFKRYFLYIFGFLCPALIHLAGTHIEVRYFYPAYVLMYSYLAMKCPWNKIFEQLKKKWITYAIIAIAFFGCLNAIWNFTFEKFNYADVLYEDGYSYEAMDLNTLMETYNGDLGVEYEIDSFGMSSSTNLCMTGRIYTTNADCNKNKLTLVLSSADMQYFFDINLRNTMLMDEIYKHSQFNINKELAALNAGEYKVGFLMQNKGDSQMVLTDYIVNIP